MLAKAVEKLNLLDLSNKRNLHDACVALVDTSSQIKELEACKRDASNLILEEMERFDAEKAECREFVVTVVPGKRVTVSVAKLRALGVSEEVIKAASVTSEYSFPKVTRITR